LIADRPVSLPAFPTSVSVVIPVYRDSVALARTLAVCDVRGAEVIVASTADDRDALSQLRREHPAVRWIEAARGRARQMNAGAAIAGGTWLLFLHADTHLPDAWRDTIAAADADRRIALGCFRFQLDSPSAFARAIELGVRARVAVCALPYGDQALFVRRDLFQQIGGYADLPIMEDVDLVRRLRRRGRLYRSPHPAVTSARKWQERGWIRPTLTHLRLITLYFLGVTPERLAASI
jgi:rSAM/selenodomain-associated transferase 2